MTFNRPPSPFGKRIDQAMLPGEGENFKTGSLQQPGIDLIGPS